MCVTCASAANVTGCCVASRKVSWSCTHIVMNFEGRHLCLLADSVPADPITADGPGSPNERICTAQARQVEADRWLQRPQQPITAQLLAVSAPQNRIAWDSRKVITDSTTHEEPVHHDGEHPGRKRQPRRHCARVAQQEAAAADAGWHDVESRDRLRVARLVEPVR